jgi:hypothetical protein
MSAVKTLRILVVAVLAWFGFLVLALVGAFMDLKILAFIAAGGLLLAKLVGFCLVVWWIVNVAFAVAEWTDEKHGDITKWD